MLYNAASAANRPVACFCLDLRFLPRANAESPRLSWSGGGLIADGWPAVNIWVSEPDPAKREALAARFSVHTSDRNDAAASSPLARWEEAQLIIAEVEGGQSAIDIINDLHARVGIPPFTANAGVGLRIPTLTEPTSRAASHARVFIRPCLCIPMS